MKGKTLLLNIQRMGKSSDSRRMWCFSERHTDEQHTKQYIIEPNYILNLKKWGGNPHFKLFMLILREYI